MKNRKYTTSLLALCAGALWLSACTKDDTAGLSDYSNTQITPQAQLSVLGIEQEPGFKSGAAQAQSQTRAAANPAQAMTLYLVRADETGNGTDVFDAYSTTPLSATRAAGAGTQALTFATQQYYLSDNARSRFTGWWPAATSYTGGVASWTLDGSQDILTAAAREGNIATPLPAFAFEHRLSKLQFEVVASKSSMVSAWGTISAVNVLAQPTTCTYTPATNAATGAVATSGSTTYNVKNFASGALTTTATARGDAMFVAPSATNVSLSLTVVSSTRGTVTVTVPARSYEAGKAYKLTLSFSDLKVAATVVPWNNITTDDQVGNLKVGMVADGGIVYWVDDTDPRNYKVVALTDSKAESVTANKTPLWATNNSYVIGAGAQSDTDGRANAAAVKSAFDNKMAGVAITESNFEDAFPAAAYCYNYKGKDGTDPAGTWYLPAKTELQYLWCAFNGKAPISWVSGTNSAAPVDATAQGVFNGYLTAAGGTEISNSGGFWSSTEVSYGTNSAWYVGFSGGGTLNNGKVNINHVRCVRDITPPPPPAIGDAKDGGIIYWVDPADATKYKVVALTDSNAEIVTANKTLKWAAQNTYAIGSGAQSDTDGKGNSAAIKSAFDNKKTTADVAIAESTFDAAFPAAAYCYNYKGKDGNDPVGTWYLPAKTELQYLWCAFNGKAPISWASSTNSAAPADTAAQKVFNGYLTAAGGTEIPASGLFWSSTEYSSSTSYAWYVGFSDGTTSISDKGGSTSVRCVRDITPPPPAIGDAKDGGIVYWVDDADPTKYKVVALTDSNAEIVTANKTLKWAAQNTYAIGSGAQSDTDGRGNVAAVKSAFDNKKTTADVAIAESTFDAAFPAAAYCYNYQGKNGADAKGTWYLPAKTELQYLWCAFNGKAPISWDSSTNSAAPADTAAQGVFNGYLTAAGGTEIPASGGFWSSTEDSSFTSSAWGVGFSHGNANNSDKYYNNYVRCVRDV